MRAQCAGFNQGKWIAVGDEEGFVHIMDGAAPALPAELCPLEPDALKPTAQWLAHHNAIFDLAWFQVGPAQTLHQFLALVSHLHSLVVAPHREG